MSRTKDVELGFVVDGCERLREAVRPGVEAEVRARHAEALAAAGPLERLRLRALIRDEVARRLDEEAPPEALY